MDDFEMPITIEWTSVDIVIYRVFIYVLKIGKEEGFKEGLQKGLKDSIIESLELKFGELPEEIKAKINSTDDIEALKEMRKKAILIQSLEEFT
ncbi:hypothetical protein [Sulfurihydrogenibium azorense]|uniref:hypothetical protein n=1 Tax=Sulfurihydrogenibium azorense TaxID=309806 RepID=UPI00259F25D6|nr:hypothetical protein [Sulfurihydrogenibium azorense]MDM7274244.1 hypothetical protein [Sulfurihydrogenibium azorense]